MKLVLVLLFTTALVSCDKPAAPKAEGDNFTHVEASDAGMNAAIAKAKETSGTFLEALRKSKPSYRGFGVKKPYPVKPKGMEHMWISDVREVGDHLEGVIANDAYETTEVKLGQKVSLKIGEISDWKYEDGKRLIGGYTIRYFYDRMSETEKKEFSKENDLVIE